MVRSPEWGGTGMINQGKKKRKGKDDIARKRSLFSHMPSHVQKQTAGKIFLSLSQIEKFRKNSRCVDRQEREGTEQNESR
jgi:hypothetical protein